MCCTVRCYCSMRATAEMAQADDVRVLPIVWRLRHALLYSAFACCVPFWQSRRMQEDCRCQCRCQCRRQFVMEPGAELMVWVLVKGKLPSQGLSDGMLPCFTLW